jgi:hypothetical protein
MEIENIPRRLKPSSFHSSCDGTAEELAEDGPVRRIRFQKTSPSG